MRYANNGSVFGGAANLYGWPRNANRGWPNRWTESSAMKLRVRMTSAISCFWACRRSLGRFGHTQPEKIHQVAHRREVELPPGPHVIDDPPPLPAFGTRRFEPYPDDKSMFGALHEVMIGDGTSWRRPTLDR